MKPNEAPSPRPKEDFSGVVRELGRGGRTAILLGLIGQVIRLALQVMLVRVLGAPVYGLYTLGRSALDILGLFSLLGFQSGAVHFVAIFNGEGDQARIRGTVLTALAIVATSSSAAGIGLWWASDWAANALFDKPALAPALRGFAAALPAYALLMLLASCVRGARHIGYYSGVIHIAHPLGNVILIAAAFAIGMKLNGVLWGFGLSTALSCILMFIGLHRLFPSLLSIRQGFHFAGARILPYISKVLFKDLSTNILTHLDRLMLGVLGVASDVGIYSISAFIGHRIDFFQRMFNNVFAPMIADLYNQGKRSEMVRIFQTVSKWALLCTLPVFYAFIFLGDVIFALLIQEFHAGWAILIVLSLGNLIDVGMGPVGLMLIMTGRPGLELFNSWVSGLSNIALNLWFIPRYGAFGAALATAITVTMLNLLRLLQVYRAHQCVPFRMGTLKVLAAFALPGSAMWLLAYIYQFTVGGKLACMAGFLVIYAGLLFAFGWDEEDQLVLRGLRRQFSRLLN